MSEPQKNLLLALAKGAYISRAKYSEHYSIGTGHDRVNVNSSTVSSLLRHGYINEVSVRGANNILFSWKLEITYKGQQAISGLCESNPPTMGA